jgi:hypothetical protein
MLRYLSFVSEAKYTNPCYTCSLEPFSLMFVTLKNIMLLISNRYRQKFCFLWSGFGFVRCFVSSVTYFQVLLWCFIHSLPTFICGGSSFSGREKADVFG